MTKSPRDSQRQKLYNSEWVWKRVNADKIETFDTIEDVRAYVELVTETDFWKNHIAWKAFRGTGPARYPFGAEKIEVRAKMNNGGGRGWSHCVESEWSMGLSAELVFAKTMFNVHVILHELCHVLVRSRFHEGHGPAFAAVLLDMVREFMGAELADSLENHMHAFGVSIGILPDANLAELIRYDEGTIALAPLRFFAIDNCNPAKHAFRKVTGTNYETCQRCGKGKRTTSLKQLLYNEAIERVKSHRPDEQIQVRYPRPVGAVARTTEYTLVRKLGDGEYTPVRPLTEQEAQLRFDRHVVRAYPVTSGKWVVAMRNLAATCLSV